MSRTSAYDDTDESEEGVNAVDERRPSRFRELAR